MIYAAIHERVVAAGDTAPRISPSPPITAARSRLPNFGGKVLVLNFWATWCPPCIEETPSLSQFAQEYARQGRGGAGRQRGSGPQAYRAFLRKFNPAFLTARDLKLHEDYGTYMYPETYIIDAKGKVLQKLAEPADWIDPKLTGYIDSLL